MAIKKGYKQTEIGIIPEDWEVKTLGEVADIIGGGTPHTSNSSFWNGFINWFIPTEIGKNKFVYESERKITNEGLHNSSAKMLPAGTILLTSRATIGDVSILKKEGCTNQGFQSLITKKDVDNEYLYYKLLTIRNIIISLASGSTFLEISPNKLRQILISIPTLPEQTAIATVLSDTDALITALDKLIVKKKLIKQGAMQNLLTGKIRLKGFKGEWVEKRLGNLGIRKGQLITDCTRKNGNIPVIAGGKTVAYYHNEYNRNENTITISASGASAGFVNFWKCKIFASDCSTIKENDEYSIKFVYYYLLNSQAEIYALQTGGAQPHVQPTDLESLKIFLPPTIAEQTAIATILSDMDAEIAALETKRDKYKQIKSGMMQELLTGKIRLIKNVKQEQTVELKPKRTKHNDQINEAVVISFLVHKFGTKQYPLSRYRYTKYAYLLHRQVEHEAKGFLKHAAGPYKSENRYKGGEGIALKNQYISKVPNPQSGKDAFVVNEHIEKALSYFYEWYGTNIQQWIEQFRYYRNDDLEVLTTVDESICDLEKQNKLINIDSIKEYIRSIPQWKAKLDKACFSDFNIQKAINESYQLFGG